MKETKKDLLKHAINLGSAQPLATCFPKVRGPSNNAKPAVKRIMPMRSISLQTTPTALHPLPFHGYSGHSSIFLAFTEFLHKDQKSGADMIGVMMAHIPKPHLQRPLSPSGPPMKGPIQTVARYGISGTLDIKARLSKSEVSAMKTCCNILREVFPAASKSLAKAYIPMEPEVEARMQPMI